MGSILGVIGGGQLGLMFVRAATRLGYRVRVYATEENSPAGREAEAETVGPFASADGLRAFASQVDALTWETEVVPWEAVAAASAVVRVRPSPPILRVTQDRIEQKRFLSRVVPRAVVPWIPVLEAADIDRAFIRGDRLRYLKRARHGYDGRGQATVGTQLEAARAWDAMDRVPCVLEEAVDYRCEFSVILARDDAGAIVSFPAIENVHRAGVLDISIFPARIPSDVEQEALAIARRVADESAYVGVLCIEFFWAAGGNVLINEMAARTHNSGHLTIEACSVSQFELHVRAVAGLPLVQPTVLSCAAMANLLGVDPGPGSHPLHTEGQRVYVHGYGKEVRPGRKTGHVTALGVAQDEAIRRATAVRHALEQSSAPR